MITKIDEKLNSFNSRLSVAERSIADLRQGFSVLGNINEELCRLQRSSDVVVRGIPYKENEKPVEIINNICGRIDHEASPYLTAFRIKSKHNANNVPNANSADRPIIARFSCFNERRAFLSALRNFGRLKLADIGGFTAQSPVLIHESITPNTNKLLLEALRLRQQGKLSSAYTRDGHMYVRLGKDDTALRISSLDKLLSLCAAQQGVAS